jgi:pSer/pThr/pTyr-binding forkhead associated (FHA) protein
MIRNNNHIAFKKKESKKMGAIRNIKPGFSTLPEPNAESESSFATVVANDREATMATVMLSQLQDTQVQMRFHRLMLMSRDNQVLCTYPLNRKITQLGRSRRNHVRIEDPMVSVKHLNVSVSGGTCVVHDLDSSNGTYINGDRLDGGRVLKDGDEIMLGQTILRYAARQADTAGVPDRSKSTPTEPFFRKNLHLLAAALLLAAVVAAGAIYKTQYAPARQAVGSLSPAAQTRNPATQPSAGAAATLHSTVETAKAADAPGRKSEPAKISVIELALSDYAVGDLDSAMQTLNVLAAARADTSEALYAQRMLSMLRTVQDLHAEALQAQEQKKFNKAVACWDRLLLMDMELIGDHPSFFAAEAEKRVQKMSYENAVEAYRQKNHEKARQLCHVILQINPNNQEALDLLARIDPKA